MSKTIEVFICTNCGYEDSSFMPIKYKNKQLGICPSCNCNVTVNIESIEMPPHMTISEFNSLLKYINKNHSFKQLEGKMIKYVSPTIDLRTGFIGCIKLDDKIFSQTNENRHRNLKEWIMQYLKED